MLSDNDLAFALSSSPVLYQEDDWVESDSKRSLWVCSDFGSYWPCLMPAESIQFFIYHPYRGEWPKGEDGWLVWLDSMRNITIAVQSYRHTKYDHMGEPIRKKHATVTCTYKSFFDWFLTHLVEHRYDCLRIIANSTPKEIEKWTR